jgi:hypothetical protein
VLLLPELLSPGWGEVPVDDEIEGITVVAVARTFVIDDVRDVGSCIVSVVRTMVAVESDQSRDGCEDVETDSPYNGDGCSSPGDSGCILCSLALSREFGLSGSIILLYLSVVVSRFRDKIRQAALPRMIQRRITSY